jgi:hypothetical protein
VSERYTTQVPMLVSRQFDDEVILANFETGLYYSMIGSAADIWLGLRSGATVKEIVKAFEMLGAHGSFDTKRYIMSFIEQLLAKKIVAPDGGVSAPQPWSPQFSNPFSPPVLECFDNLRDLLLLDPVHDVSNAGWPVQAQDGD